MIILHELELFIFKNNMDKEKDTNVGPSYYFTKGNKV